MPRASRTLHTAINESHIAGVDFLLVSSVLRDVCKCLAHLHQHGIIHGDIKVTIAAKSCFHSTCSCLLLTPILTRTNTNIDSH